MAEIKRYVVIGLGSFGSALAARLAHHKCRVTGIDSRRDNVERLKNVLYEAVVGNATERETLEALNLDDCTAVFISLGEDITQSILATLHAQELGARRIIVKGVTPEHGKILKRLGVDRIVFPEIEIAEELADRISWPNIIDFLPIDPEYSFVEIAVPEAFVGKTLRDIDLRRKFNVSMIGVKDAMTGKLQLFPDAEYKFGPDQIVMFVGKHDDVNKLRAYK